MVNGLLKSLNGLLKPSPILSDGLELPLMLILCCSDEWILNTMKDFVVTCYTQHFTGLIADINSDKDYDFEIDLDI